MKIVCSWCRKEGGEDIVGEKPPFDDGRETHGICTRHRQEVQDRWHATLRQSAGSSMGSGVSSALFQWTGLLNVTKKLRP